MHGIPETVMEFLAGLLRQRPATPPSGLAVDPHNPEARVVLPAIYRWFDPPELEGEGGRSEALQGHPDDHRVPHPLVNNEFRAVCFQCALA
jgi:hypothetical protein